MALAVALKSDATPLDEPATESSEMPKVEKIVAQVNKPSQKSDPRIKGKCNFLHLTCKNQPVPGEFYCTQHLHNPQMRRHAEQKLIEAQRKLDFLGIGIGDTFAPAFNLLKKAETAFDAEELVAAYHLALQAIGKALELNARPRVERAIVLRDEFGFLDRKAADLATQAESETKKPRPNWPQASMWAAGAINALQPYQDRAERSRQIRMDQALAKANEQALAKANREAREAAEEAKRDKRAAQCLSVGGNVPLNTGTLSEKDQREVETMLRKAHGKTDKQEDKTQSKGGNKKSSSKGKKKRQNSDK